MSLVAADPLREDDGSPVRPGPAAADVRALLARLELDGSAECSEPFSGGFLGALSYDLGVAGEDQDLPPIPGPPRKWWGGSTPTSS